MNQTNTLLGTDEPALTTPTSEERTMAILSHILCIVAWFIAPLVIYLVKKDESAYVRAHARESLNFQITLFLAWIAVWIVSMILGFIVSFFSFFLMPFIFLILGIGALVLIIIATIRASENKLYKYPFSLKLVK
jgi:uncharacterized protein